MRVCGSTRSPAGARRRSPHKSEVAAGGPEATSHTPRRRIGRGLRPLLYTLVTLTQPSHTQLTALVKALAPDRLRRFRSVFGGSTTPAMELYLLDIHVASALHGMVAVVEVSLREAMHRALRLTFGTRWFSARRDLFDDRTREQLSVAVQRAGSSPAAASEGKVVAEITLGAWTALLDVGGYAQDGNRRVRKDYETTLWVNCLEHAFPSAAARRDVAHVARRVRYARNRLAHHEPVVFGVPLPGQRVAGKQTRRTPQGVIDDIRCLARYLDADLGSWLDVCRDADRLAADPVAQAALAHMAGRAALM